MSARVTPPRQRQPVEQPSTGAPPPIEVGEAERCALLVVARLAIAAAVGAATSDLLDAACHLVPGERRAAAFVTLTENGRLRGCMGSVDPEAPVWVSVMEAAGWAAQSDPRLRPVQPAELDRLEVAVSVLGPLVPLAVPEAFRLGIDGIVVRRGQRRGLLLPEVGERPGIAQRTMLAVASEKAGLPRDAWRHEGTEVLAFRTARFAGPVVASPGGPTSRSCPTSSSPTSAGSRSATSP